MTIMELEQTVKPRLGLRSGHLNAVLHSEAFEMKNVDVELGYTL